MKNRINVKLFAPHYNEFIKFSIFKNEIFPKDRRKTKVTFEKKIFGAYSYKLIQKHIRLNIYVGQNILIIKGYNFEPIEVNLKEDLCLIMQPDYDNKKYEK